MAVMLSRETPHGLWAPPRRAVTGRWWSSPSVVLFVMLLCVYAYTPPRWQDWNQNSRFDLTLALVEQRSVRIDAYAGNTGDYATIDGHIYSDKAPGLSFIATPVYAATRLLQPLGLGALTHRLGSSGRFTPTLSPGGAGVSAERLDFAVALFLATIVCVAAPAAGMAVLVARIVERLWGCRTAGLLTALVIGLATPLFTYAQAFYGHLPAAACLLTAFALLVLRPGGTVGNGRLLSLGFLLGWAAIIEYPAALVGLPIALWAVALARSRAVLLGALGALPPLGLLAAYDLAAFGTVLPVGYAHSTLWQAQHQQGFLSLTHPKWAALWGVTGSPFRGLFFLAPVLLLAGPGAWLALRARPQRASTIVALAGFGATLLFVASSAMWWGGFGVGPRYLLPALPFLAPPLGATIAWINGRPLRVRLPGLTLVAALAALSLGLVWALTFARQGYPPDTIQRPLTDYALPALRDGDIARNLGMIVGLRGPASLLPLALIVAAGVARIALGLLPAREVAA